MHRVRLNKFDEQSCDNGTVSCPKCPNLYTKKREDLNFHLASIMPRKMLNLLLCVLCAWKNSWALLPLTAQEEKACISKKIGTKSSETRRYLRNGGAGQKIEKIQQELNACQLFLTNRK